MSRTVADFVTNVAEEYLFVPIASRYFIRIVVVICQGKFGDSNLMMTDTDFFKIPMGIFFFHRKCCRKGGINCNLYVKKKNNTFLIPILKTIRILILTVLEI